ncbi:MAG: hypothetical protein ACM362_00950 [Candidatus Methylomirabilota bacterium]
MYYQVITFILIFPWLILAISILGHLSTRPVRKSRPTIVHSGGDPPSRPTISPTRT